MKQLARGRRINTWAALSSLSLEGSGLLWLAKGRRESLGPGDRIQPLISVVFLPSGN